MNGNEPPEIEDESLASKAARRRKWLRRTVEEFAFALLFLAAFFVARYFSRLPEPSTLFASVGLFVVVAVLFFWLSLHVRRLKSLDEFERIVEVQSLALAGGSAALFAAAWGAAEIILHAPDFPLVMMAPLYSGFYALARLRISSAFR